MTTRFALAAALTVVLAGCAGNDVQTTGTATVSAAALGSYQSYALSPKRTLSLRNPSLNTTTVQGWLDSAVNEALTGKGYVGTSPGTADLLVSYEVGSRVVSGQRQQASWTGFGLDEEGGTGFVPVAGTGLSDYEEGRLNLFLIDRRSGKTVYQGSTTAALLEQPSTARSTARINQMVNGMLANLPRR